MPEQIVVLESIAYLIFQIFKVHLRYYCFDTLFHHKKWEGWYVFGAFAGHWAIWSAAYLLVGNPYLTMIVNVGTLLCVSYFFGANWRQRVINTVLTWAFSLLSETAAFYIAGFGQKPNMQDVGFTTFLLTLLISNLLLLSIVLFLRYRNRKSQKSIINAWMPIKEWVFIVIILALIGYLSIVIARSSVGYGATLFSEVTLLLLVFLVFTLYENLQLVQNQELEKMSLNNQIRFLQRESQLWKENQTNIMTLRHDMKNHLLYLEQCEKTGKHTAFAEYMQSLLGQLSSVRSPIDTGNLEIDLLLSCKLDEAEKKGIQTELKLQVPANMRLDAMTTNIILGNLLDNAIKATEKLPEEQRRITIRIGLQHVALSILVENPYAGALCPIDEAERIPLSRGLGLKNVSKTVKKSGGYFLINTEDHIFSAHILLYLQQPCQQ